MDPTCPQDYSCAFTLLHPRVVSHAYGPWYNSPLGIVFASIVAVTAVVAIGWLASALLARRDDRAKLSIRAMAEREERNHALAIEEQRTLQADMAKGDIDFLRLLRTK